MKKTKVKLLLLAVCCFTTVSIKAQNGDTVIQVTQINKSIQAFAKLLDSQQLQKFGLKSIDELKALKPGKQFKKLMIGLNDIKKFKQGDDVQKIIKDYPSIEVSLVDQAGNIKTSIEFVMNQGKWEASRYGSTHELAILRNAQTALANSDFQRGSLIRIPALRISFIAVSSAAGLEFINLEDNQKLNLKKGEKIAASAAILRLVPLAAKHNGLPS